MGPKRRKTESAAPVTTNKQSDQEQSITAALCERLVQCQGENGPDAHSAEFKIDIDANIPENIKLRAHQAASILQSAITELQAAIDTAAALANGNRAAVASTMEQAQELVAYAHRLSFTTGAPPGFIPGQSQLLHFKPPAPQDIQLRSSALHQFQREYELRLKEGERAVAFSAEKKGKEPAATAPPPSTRAAAPEEPKEPPTAAAPVNLAGILSSLPPMPAGWKPGDAIPGLAALGEAAPIAATAQPLKPTIPATTQPQKPAPAAPVAAPRPSSAFDFSLNPDMELEFDVGDSSESDDDDSDSD